MSGAVLSMLGGPPAAPPKGAELWCECTVAESGNEREWLLGGYRAPSPRLAVRWMGEQTQRLADLIDPNPFAPWIVPSALNVVTAESAEDAPTVFRQWRHDVAEQDQALHAMRDGALYLFTVRDVSGLAFRLSARPLLAHPRPAPFPSPTANGSGTRSPAPASLRLVHSAGRQRGRHRQSTKGLGDQGAG